MAVTNDIVRTWRNPRGVMRDLLADGVREDRALVFLLAACLLTAVAQWPRLARQAAGFEPQPGIEQLGLSELMMYGLFGWIIFAPLFFYALAGVSHLVARAVGGNGTHARARMALFWSLLAATPALLLYGLTTGFIGPGLQANIVGGIWVAAFGWFWLQSLREAEA